MALQEYPSLFQYAPFSVLGTNPGLEAVSVPAPFRNLPGAGVPMAQPAQPQLFDFNQFTSPGKGVGAQLAAQYRMQNALYNRAPQVDLSGITDIGSGLAKGMQNLGNAINYNRQMGNQEAMFAEMGQAAQDQAMAEQQAKSAQMQQLYTSLVNQGVPPNLAIAGIITGKNELYQPYITKQADVYGTNLSRRNDLATAETLLPQINPTTVDGKPAAPNPNALNTWQLMFGSLPGATNLSVQKEVLGNQQTAQDILGKQMQNYVAQQTLPAQVANPYLANEGTALQNQTTGFNLSQLPQRELLSNMKALSDYYAQQYGLNEKMDSQQKADALQQNIAEQVKSGSFWDQGNFMKLSVMMGQGDPDKTLQYMKYFTSDEFKTNFKGLKNTPGLVPTVEQPPTTFTMPQPGSLSLGLLKQGLQAQQNLPLPLPFYKLLGY